MLNPPLRECKTKRTLQVVRALRWHARDATFALKQSTDREIPHRSNDCAHAKRRRLITKCFDIFLDVPQISRANESLAM
jgi:hypothetical protein